MIKILKENLIFLVLKGSQFAIIGFCLSSFIQIFIGSQFGRQSELFDFLLSFTWLLMYETLASIKIKPKPKDHE